MSNADQSVTLPADTNQALGLARFAIEFMSDDPDLRGEPDQAVRERTELFHLDACLCGVSALAMGTNAPNVFRQEALRYRVGPTGFGTMGPAMGRARRMGVPMFGSTVDVHPEKAIAAGCAAVREWDANGTNFGFNPRLAHTAGEFGHNDFYPVAVAAAQLVGGDGDFALRGMILLDEIRGRLAEVFSLKTYKIDHVLHGAIASAAVYGAMLGATPEQIESAIGMVVAHHVPFRAIRAGRQLSDSKGASAAISTEAAIVAVHRAMDGFVGPGDVFRNPEAIFRLFEGPGRRFVPVGEEADEAREASRDASPFDLVLTRAGGDFRIMGMHIKLALYEHQSAGAVHGLIDLLEKNPALLDEPDGGRIASIKIIAYEPAFGIIGDPAKRDPTTRQSADHSMVYIVATLLRKALEHKRSGWKELMLNPLDYSREAINNPLTRRLMERITFEHGGPEYDTRYPDGIPTSVIITDRDDTTYDSGLVMYPAGHARNTTDNLEDLHAHKMQILGRLAADDPQPIIERLSDVGSKSARELASIYDFTYARRGRFE